MIPTFDSLSFSLHTCGYMYVFCVCVNIFLYLCVFAFLYYCVYLPVSDYVVLYLWENTDTGRYTLISESIFWYLWVYLLVSVCVFLCPHVSYCVFWYTSVYLLVSSCISYICVCLCFQISIFTTTPLGQDYDTRSVFKRSLTGLNSEFSFS